MMPLFRWYFTDEHGPELGVTAGFAFLAGVLSGLVGMAIFLAWLLV